MASLQVLPPVADDRTSASVINPPATSPVDMPVVEELIPTPIRPSALQIRYEDAFDFRKMDSLRFLVQVFLTATVLLLCVGNLPKADPETRAIYWGGITGIIAWWMPTPGSSKAQCGPEDKGR